MEAFKKGRNNILIATDVSARGIDIPDVNYVINYDLPEKKENYVHRVGRTGRGTKKGVAVSFCSSEEKPLLNEIQQFLNKKIETIPVSRQDYADIVKYADNPDTQTIRELILEHEKWEKKKRKKKKF
jgi:ATP-dependent RNA helicase RhlE